MSSENVDASKGAGQAKDEKKKDEKTLAELEHRGHGGGHGGHGGGRGNWHGGRGWGGN